MSRRRSDIAALALVFGFAFGLALHYARMGFHPLDGSIVFDAGWRMLSGQVPLRDFAAPESIAPGALQAALFAALGVDWFAYSLHAALLNGAFAATAFLLLRGLGVERRLSLFSAAASGVAFQPPMGFPFPELHAFFFVLAAVLLGVAGMRARRPLLRTLAMACVPVQLALAFLSYKNPSAFAAPLVLLGALVAPGARRWNALGLALGSLCVALVLLGLIEALDIDPGPAWLEFWTRPRELGLGRMPRSLAEFVVNWFERGIYREGLLLTGVVWALLVLLALAGPRLWRLVRRSDALLLPALAVAFGLEAVGLAFRSTVLNHPLVGMGFLFPAFGLLVGSLQRLPLPEAARGLQRLGLRLALVLIAFDLAHLSLWVNHKRVVNEMFFDPAQATRPVTPELSSLRYQSPGFYRTSARDLDRVIGFLRERPENFLLIGDHSILYGLTGKPSVAPSLWFHDGLTAPKLASPAFAAHRRRMLERVEALGVGWIVVEGNRTGMRSRLSHYPELDRRIAATGCAPLQIGNFSIHRIGSPGDCR